MRYSHGLEYKVSKSGVAVLCGIGNCTDEHLVIPSDVEGYPIVGISDKAFARLSQIKSISLPSSVAYIGEQAFAWCHNLIEVRSFNICHIGKRAFMGCDKLSSLAFGNMLETVGEKAFAHCSALRAVAFPNSITRLGASAFEGCRNLCKICLSDNISVIENGTFYACGSLCKVILPTALEYIDEYAFAYCSSITEMNVSAKTVINQEAFFECGVSKNGKAS